MRSIQRSLRWLVVAVLALAFLGDASASAFEAHNQIEPPFGSFKQLRGLTVDQSNGNVYGTEWDEKEGPSGEVKVFGREGGAPAGGGPSSFTGAGSPRGSFTPYTTVAVDPSSGVVYVPDFSYHVVDKYRLNGSNQYEYVSAIESVSGPEGSQLQGLGLAVDAAGDVYIGSRIGYEAEGVVEFNAAGEQLQMFEGVTPFFLAVSSSGTIYALRYEGEEGEVVELRRSSVTGPVEGAPVAVPHTKGVKGLAFDRATGQLFVDLGSYGEALNGAHEVVSRFGSGVISHGGPLAVDEATGEVYVGNGTEHNIDRFGPGVITALPAVDEPPPSLSAVTRTSVLLSGTVNTEDATTKWQLQYVSVGEYQPAVGNPYAAGGSTPLLKLAAAVGGTGVGPLALTGLLAGTTYHYRLVASNELGTTYGPDHTFATAAATPPIVTTGAAGEVTQTGVTLSGTVVPRELQTSYVFEVGTDTTYGGAKLFGNAGSAGTEAVSVGLQFLIPGVTYHYRLVASNADGTSYGQDMTFSTPGVSASIVQPPTPLLISTPVLAFPAETSTTMSRALTNAQKLAKALKACAKKAKGRRAGCKRQARRRYGSGRGLESAIRHEAGRGK